MLFPAVECSECGELFDAYHSCACFEDDHEANWLVALYRGLRESVR